MNGLELEVTHLLSFLLGGGALGGGSMAVSRLRGRPNGILPDGFHDELRQEFEGKIVALRNELKAEDDVLHGRVNDIKTEVSNMHADINLHLGRIEGKLDVWSQKGNSA